MKYKITTSKRTVFMHADSQEHARLIFIRDIPAPEPYPDGPVARVEYYDRWPVLQLTEYLVDIVEA